MNAAKLAVYMAKNTTANMAQMLVMNLYKTIQIYE